MYVLAMQLPFIGEAGAEALLRCLIHSLWIGGLAAFVAVMVMQLSVRYTRLKYQLLVAVLAVFAGVSGFVIINQLISLQITVPSEIQRTEVVAENWYKPEVRESEKFMPLSIIYSFIQSYSSWLILFWLITIVYKSSRLVTGYAYLLQIKQQSLPVTEPEWINRLNVLVNKMGIRKNVQLRWSATHAIPMVIGIMKPVIILPVAILNSLSTSAAEAILLHELSHIRRRDFLINILQECLEIIFFFNPAVIWISSCIRRERENCCDDQVITITQNKLEYVNALVSFQEYHIRESELITAFPGERNHLFHRVNRIINSRNKSMNNMEKFLLASIIILGCAATAAFSKISGEEEKNSTFLQTVSLQSKLPDLKVIREDHSIPENDTIPKKINVTRSPLVEYRSVVEGKTYTIVEKNGKVYTLKIDGKNVDSGEFHKHQQVINRIREQMSEEQEWESEVLKRKYKELLEIEMHLNALNDELRKKSHEMQLINELNTEQLNKVREGELYKVKEEQLLNKQLVEKEMLNARKALEDQLRLLNNYEIRQNELQLIQENERLIQEKLSEKQKELYLKQEDLVAEQAKTEQIIKFLINEGVIKEDINLEFSISEESLIINGKKQPDSLHKKMMEKFFGKSARPFKFSYHR